MLVEVFTISIRFAAQVSRDPLGCARDCAHINWKVVSGKVERRRAREVSEVGSLRRWWSWKPAVASFTSTLRGSAGLKDLSS